KSKSNVPVDIQAWAIMALKSDRGKYLRGLQYAESHHEIRGGYDFNQVDGDRDGIWYEGTAQIADAFKQTGKIEKWKELIQLLRSAQFTSGAIPATDVESIATGFKLPDSENDWLYFRYPHVGATAWFILAESGVNPFWFEHAY
ncbi:MAG: hypothetical protein U0984_11190, partial [Prosthecobacter sp.]|nr:hypothetical protein [Prosthecobacter sp.]